MHVQQVHHFADKTSREWLPVFLRRLIRPPVWILALFAVCLGSEAPGPAPAPTVRIRVEWSGAAGALWSGRLEIHGGRLARPQSFASAGDDAGSIAIEGEILAIRRRSPRPIDGFEVSVTAHQEAWLELELHDEHDGPQVPIQLSLADCFHKSRVFAAEASRPRVVIRRAPGDSLDVHFDRPHLVFNAAEAFRFAVALNLLENRDKLGKPVKATLKWKLTPAVGSRIVVEGSAAIAARVNAATPAEVPLEVRMPNEEGVYNLRLAATGRGFTDVERVVQLVVFNAVRSDPANRTQQPEKRSAPLEVTARRRLVGRYLHRPEMAPNAGVTPSLGASEHRDSDDWQTFLGAGRRLIETLHSEEQSGLLMAVLAEGATIYPSQFVEPSLRFDNGRQAPNGQDPVTKDVFELVLRLCDRAGLAVIPELQFDAPLPALERMLIEPDDSSEDLQLLNDEGRTPAETDAAPGRLPAYYNVLSPRVQQAVLDVVHELIERYAGHPSLAGVAFELSPHSFLQLPGIEWGYDRETIHRFEQVTGIRVPRGEGKEGRQQVYRFLTTTARREWIRFRCSEVARFHQKLAELVTMANSEARVIFSGHLNILGESAAETAVIEAVRAAGNPVALLHGQGLDFSLAPYANERNITVARPLIHNDTADTPGRAAYATLNSSPAIDAAYRHSGRGGLIYSTASVSHGREVNTGRVGSESAAAPQAFSHLETAARRYAHLLATLDARVIFDDSPGLPMPPDATAGRIFMRTIASLPDVAFRFTGPQVQPIVIRAAHSGNATWLYAVNDSSLAVKVEMILDCPATTTCLRLDSGKPLALEPGEGAAKPRLRLELSGHGLFACRFDRPDVEVRETGLKLSDGLLDDMHQRIDLLSRRMNSVMNLARAGANSLPNPGFEQPGAGASELPGWGLSVTTADWALDEDNPRSGQRSLQLSAAGGESTLKSPDLQLQGTRYVTMSLWMRSNKSTAGVQMLFDANLDGDAFRREALVEVGKSWKRHQFRVDDLPPGRLQNARLQVKPVDSCKLWIDDVEIDAQPFGADDVRQLTKTLSSVKLACKEGRYADCQRLLEGYWGQLLIADPVAAPAVAPDVAPDVAPSRHGLGDRMRKIFRR